MFKKQKARYAGTIIYDGRDRYWSKPYRKEKMWIRGNGEIWLDKNGIHFHRFGIEQEIFIPFNKIKDLQFGYWHARGWQMWLTIKVIYEHDGKMLSGGFVVSRKKEKTHVCTNMIRKNIRLR